MESKAKLLDGLSKHDYWEKHIVQWEETGLSQSDYRAKHGLNQHVFSYWKKKLRPKEKLKSKRVPTSLVPVTIQPEPLKSKPCIRFESSSGLSFRVSDGIRLDIEEHFNADTLRRVMSVIGSM